MTFSISQNKNKQIKRKIIFVENVGQCFSTPMRKGFPPREEETFSAYYTRKNYPDLM